MTSKSFTWDLVRILDSMMARNLGPIIVALVIVTLQLAEASYRCQESAHMCDSCCYALGSMGTYKVVQFHKYVICECDNGKYLVRV